MHFGGWTTTNATVSATMTVSFAPPPRPMCACGCGQPATNKLEPGGTLWTAACARREQMRIAIAAAPHWLMGAFQAVPDEARGKLYRALAAVFHPDTGGDPALMVALNAARERNRGG